MVELFDQWSRDEIPLKFRLLRGVWNLDYLVQRFVLFFVVILRQFPEQKTMSLLNEKPVAKAFVGLQGWGYFQSYHALRFATLYTMARFESIITKGSFTFLWLEICARHTPVMFSTRDHHALGNQFVCHFVYGANAHWCFSVNWFCGKWTKLSAIEEAKICAAKGTTEVFRTTSAASTCR